MTVDQEWPAQWLRGVLELCVLALMAGGCTPSTCCAAAASDWST